MSVHLEVKILVAPMTTHISITNRTNRPYHYVYYLPDAMYELVDDVFGLLI